MNTSLSIVVAATTLLASSLGFANSSLRDAGATVQGTVQSIEGGMLHLMTVDGGSAIIYTTRAISAQFKQGQRVTAHGRSADGDWLKLADTEVTSLDVTLVR